MKYTIKKIILLFTFYCPLLIFAQRNVDGNFLFKTWLYIEHENDSSVYSTDFPVKDAAVFSLFMDNISLKLDTLKTNGFPDSYIFLAINFKSPEERSKGTDSSLRYDRKTKFLNYIGVPALCNRYVLCVNKSTGLSYRLQGFTGNDFLNLLRDVRQGFYQRYKKQLKTKTFFKDYAAGQVDFECIYQGLQSGEVDPKKYPCLGDCRGQKEIIWIR